MQELSPIMEAMKRNRVLLIDGQEGGGGPLAAAVHDHSHNHRLVGDTCTRCWCMGNGSKSGTSVFAEEVIKRKLCMLESSIADHVTRA